MSDPILTVVNLDIALPAGADRPYAVKGINLDLRPAEILCIVGESGSGKSILSSAIIGALPRGLNIRGGAIRLRGEEMTGLTEAEWRGVRGRRVAMIPQEPMAALNPSMRVGRQIEEVFDIHKAAPRGEWRSRALALIQSMGLPDPERIAAAYPHQLSGGQCQRICIAMALALKPEVLIADEPTTALDVTTQAQVLKLVRDLRDQHGQSVMFITHDLGVVADIADRVAVIQKGDLVEIGDARQVLTAPRHPYTQALIRAVPSAAPANRPARETATGAKGALQVEALSKSYGARRILSSISLSVAPATTLAVVGESGCGKSTLARLLVRLTQPNSGRVLINGLDMAGLSGDELRLKRRAIQMIFQDPFGSLNPRRTVGDVIARAAERAGAHPKVARTRALALLEQVGMPATAYHRRPAAFSGGQRQRIGIARALAMNPDILIADESVSALDVSVQAQILTLLEDLQKALGLTIIFITHDLRVAAQISDRIVVMRAGEIVEEGLTRDVLLWPQHAYTQALLAAAPGATSAAEGRLVVGIVEG
jgi:peptide/nickel transport system ATP-binding protein